jgi:prophage maintenance system killer protein
MSTTAQSTATQYLTVQDILWINTQVTKKTNPFRYADLEEATFYQYGYGVSTNILKQAAHFLKGFMKNAPFGVGDDATAFVAFVAFLELNGYEINLPDREAADWARRIKSGEIAAESAVEKLTQITAGHHENAPQECMERALANYPATIEALA